MSEPAGKLADAVERFIAGWIESDSRFNFDVLGEAVARYRAACSPAERWRVGRKVGRTIYRQLGPEPSDADPLIGMMDTRELAAAAVAAHNARAGQ